MGKKLKSVGIFANLKKGSVQNALKRLIENLGNTKYLIEEKLSEKLGVGPKASIEQLSKTDMIIVLGGDGTMLLAARLFSKYGVPLLGVNLGRLGFLTELMPDEFSEAIPRIIDGNYEIEERMMLQAFAPNIVNEPLCGLNEVTIDKGGSPRLLSLSVAVSCRLVSHINADGIVIATPTGSTAYSMAAGGAIMAPHTDAFIITALAPYTLSIRPLVVGSKEIIEIEYKTHDKENLPHLTVDGQVCFILGESGKVIVKRSEYKAKLVSYHKRTFYDVLRTKLGWGPPPLTSF